MWFNWIFNIRYGIPNVTPNEKKQTERAYELSHQTLLIIEVYKTKTQMVIGLIVDHRQFSMKFRMRNAAYLYSNSKESLTTLITSRSLLKLTQKIG